MHSVSIDGTIEMDISSRAVTRFSSSSPTRTSRRVVVTSWRIRFAPASANRRAIGGGAAARRLACSRLSAYFGPSSGTVPGGLSLRRLRVERGVQRDLRLWCRRLSARFRSASGTVPEGLSHGGYELSEASSVISGTAASAFETGQFFLASSAACSKPASSRPSTSPWTVRWIAVMPKPPSTLSSVT
jgi:hypothetical protein